MVKFFSRLQYGGRIVGYRFKTEDMYWDMERWLFDILCRELGDSILGVPLAYVTNMSGIENLLDVNGVLMTSTEANGLIKAFTVSDNSTLKVMLDGNIAEDKLFYITESDLMLRHKYHTLNKKYFDNELNYSLRVLYNDNLDSPAVCCYTPQGYAIILNRQYFKQYSNAEDSLLMYCMIDYYLRNKGFNLLKDCTEFNRIAQSFNSKYPQFKIPQYHIHWN